jgi:peptidoglycan/LPS O-acetylase OafA/YrhL
MDSLALGILLAWSVRFANLTLPRLPTIAPLSALGRISYPAYLFHMPCSGVTVWLFGASPLGAGSALIITIAVSAALHAAVENPAHNWMKRRTNQPIGCQTLSLTYPRSSSETGIAKRERATERGLFILWAAARKLIG